MRRMGRAALAACAVVAVLVFCVRQRSHKPNKCEMTYMYRYMFFMPVLVNTSVVSDEDEPAVQYRYSTDFSAYSTVLYGEGYYAEKYISTGKVSGIPVIFVPGNAGSARQVRSLGSLLLNKTESRNVAFVFDAFAVDFNEELTGIAGMYLERQIRYLQLSVRHILGMYSTPPRGVVFIGHSMGGIVIRSLLRSPHFDPSIVALIITFATPHKAPPVLFDDFMEDVYEKMHTKWAERGANIPVISISGGLKDVLVPEHLTRERTVSHFSTTAIHSVELETDHLCIVWCNQLVRHTSRVLFDYASSPETFRTRAKHVLNRFYASNGNSYSRPAEVRRRAQNVLVDRHIQYLKNGGNSSVEFVVSLVSSNDSMFALFNAGPSWVFVDGTPFAATRSFRRIQYAWLSQDAASRDVSVILAPQHSLKICAVAHTQQPSIDFDSMAFVRGLFSDIWEVDLEGEQAVNALSIRFGAVWYAVNASLRTISCTEGTKGRSRIDFVSESVRRLSDDDGQGVQSLIAYTLNDNALDASLLFLLDRRCTFHASVSVAFADSFNLMIKQYAVMIPLCIFGYIMCALMVATFLSSLALECRASNIHLFCTSVFLYALFIGFRNTFDVIWLTLSSVTVATIFWLLQMLSALIVQKGLKPATKWINLRTSIAAHCAVVVALIFNYSYNGFLSLIVLVPLNLYSSVRETSEACETWSPLALLVVLHALTVALFAPFGVCSVWNFLRHEAVSVYEDPVRPSAYLLGTAILARSLLGRRRFVPQYFTPAVVLTVLTVPRTFFSMSRLGFLAVTVIAAYPFTLPVSSPNSPGSQTQ